MSTNTTNLNLVKPDYGEALDVSDINGNMDIIDGAVGGLQDSVSPLVNNTDWIVAPDNLNNYTSSGSWSYTGGVSNEPEHSNGTLIVINLSHNRILQIAFIQGSKGHYYRHLIGDSWSVWYSF